MKLNQKNAANSSSSSARSLLSILKDADPAKFLCLVVLVIYAPAIMAIALLVVLTSAGPAFISRPYRRPNGDEVDLLEFRTECWQRYQPTWVGNALRRTHLLRMPALVNVLRGDVQAGERVKAI